MSKTCTNTRERSANKLKCLGDIGELDASPIPRTGNWSTRPNERSEHVFLYVMACEQFTKVGLAQDVQARLRQLQTANPFPIRLHGSWKIPRILQRETEARIHRALAKRQVRSEWFEVDPDIAARWVNTMAAVANEQYAEGTFAPPRGWVGKMTREQMYER